MRAIWKGIVTAESDHTVVVEGNHYVPPQAVRWNLLTPSHTRTRCHWKGQAHCWSIKGGDEAAADVAWAYPHPSPAAHEIAGHVAFWRGVKVSD
ncbi:DUF427 domain-containing protein [Georgenia sp. AZ-5]|uniref:DUF427 domain-containing protein n=1 Tax=Georgenia sp. AZ-5 TaxID=3367526 RepID=UPI003754D56D